MHAWFLMAALFMGIVAGEWERSGRERNEMRTPVATHDGGNATTMDGDPPPPPKP